MKQKEGRTEGLGHLNGSLDDNYLVIFEHLHFLGLVQDLQYLLRFAVQDDIILAGGLNLLEQGPVVLTIRL